MKITMGEASWSDSTYHSEIYYGTDETGRKIVLKKARVRLPKERQETIEFIFGFQHPNLLLPLEWENNEGYFTEIYPFIKWPRLDKLLYQTQKDSCFSLDEALRIMIQLTDVLGLFHANKIVHHDVRKQNLFVNPNGLELKLFDFNSATKPYNLEQGVDTWNPVPPEYRIGNCQIDFQFDVYQAGVIFMELTHEYNFNKKQMIPTISLHPTVIELVNCATSGDRNKRYKDCREFYNELKKV